MYRLMASSAEIKNNIINHQLSNLLANTEMYEDWNNVPILTPFQKQTCTLILIFLKLVSWKISILFIFYFYFYYFVVLYHFL